MMLILFSGQKNNPIKPSNSIFQGMHISYQEKLFQLLAVKSLKVEMK